jgi:hypothetical protein
MKIAWLNDYKVGDYLGGAELTNHYWIKKGQELGFEIVEVDHTEQIPKADYYVLANCTRFKVDDLLQLPEYSIITHGVALLPAVVYQKANNACYMSPSHLIKNKGLNEHGFFSAPYVDHKLFYPTNEDRPERNVYVGWILKHKGIENIVSNSRVNKSPIDFYGNGDEELIKSLKYRGFKVYPEVSPDKLNEVYNRYRYFVWILGRYGSYGRTLVEAIMAGNKLIVDSKNFGLFSYRWDFSDRQAIIDQLENELNSFWPRLLA